jgi:hypothetical protein
MKGYGQLALLLLLAALGKPGLAADDRVQNMDDKRAATRQTPLSPPAELKPMPTTNKPFRPSEKIRADSAISFPVDI